MRYFLQSLVTVLLLFPAVLQAQEDVSVRKKDFRSGKEGFAEAWKHVEAGDSYYSEGIASFGIAFDEYLQAFVYNNSNAELNYKTGASALFSDRKEEAAGFLLKAIELKSDVAADAFLLAGRALQYSGRFSEAIEKYNQYLESQGKKSSEIISLAKRFIEECSSGVIITSDTLNIQIINLDESINSVADDYSAIFSSDGKTIYFGSRREVPGAKTNSDSKFDENIFTSELVNNSWVKAVPAGKNLMTKYCETPVYITPDKNNIYIYSGYVNGGDIKMSSINKKGEWKNPASIPFRINTKKSETSFSFTPDGNEIYFVTDNGKDNLGGKDIYFIKKLKEKKWSKPQNAGPVINTIYDEESVRFSVTGDTLWFSSKGHDSMGGFDIFYSVRTTDNQWDSVKNAGYPVNTPWDELFYFPSPSDDTSFYFVSNRSGGYGGMDIYKGVIMPVPEIDQKTSDIVSYIPVKPDTIIIRDTVVVKEQVQMAPAIPVVQSLPEKEKVFYLAGSITDSETGVPVLARIDIIDMTDNTVIATSASSDTDGKYKISLPEKKSYIADIRATGFISDLKRINIPLPLSSDIYAFDISMNRIKVGKKVVLKNILFESGKSVLTTASYAEIDRLADFMKDNPAMKIEISGHTDKTGSEPLNLKLSESRAKAVMDYLLQKSISEDRIIYKGIGSLQPIADNATPKGRTENRRVEFKIIEF